MRRSFQALSARQAASQDIYQAQQQSQQDGSGKADSGSTTGGNGKGSTDDVTDVEFEEMDNKS